jgi:hypothetical protein
MTTLGASAGAGAISWSTDAIRHDPLGFLAFHDADLRSLGALLERIADALPFAAGGAGPMLAAARLRRCAAGPTPCEKALCALIEAADAADESARAVAALARREAEDGAGAAIELADALERLAQDGGCAAPEALGFMLRAGFESLRRRADWLQAVLLPAARSVTAGCDAAALGERLAAMAGPAAPRSGFAVVQGGRA